MKSLGIIQYMSGLTGFILEEDVLLRIAHDRHFHEGVMACDLSQRDRDLLLADILFTVLCSPSGLPSRSHQHGQFSEWAHTLMTMFAAHEDACTSAWG